MTVSDSPPARPPTADFPLLNSPTRPPYQQDGPTFDVDTAIEATGLGTFQYIVLLLTGLAWTAESMEMLLLSFIKSPLQCEWRISDEQAALITTFVAVGMLIGAVAWGVVADRFGRRAGFIGSTVFTAVLGLVSAVSVSYPMMLVSRGLVGIGIGGVPVSFSVLMEVLPARKRGSWGLSLAFFWAIGAIFEAGVAMAVLPSLGWRWLIAISSLPLFIVILLVFWLPESPRWLVAHGKLDEAQTVLERIASVNGRPLPEGRVMAPVGPAPDDVTPHTVPDTTNLSVSSDYIAPESPVVATGTSTAAPPVSAPAPVAHDAHRLEGGQSPFGSDSLPAANKSGIASLVRPGARGLAVQICTVWFVVALVYYGVVMLQPELISAENAGHRCLYAATECAAQTTDAGCKAEHICTWKDAKSCVPTGTLHHTSRLLAVRAEGVNVTATPEDGVSKAEKRDPACARQLTQSDFMATLWASTGELPGVLVALLLVNVIGRRPLLGYMCLISMVGFFTLTQCIGRMGETIIFFVTRGSTTAIFQTIYLYTNEVYPSVVRARAMGMASAIARTGLVITPFVAQYLSNVNASAALSIYATASFFALIAVFMMAIETTSRPLVDSMEELVDNLRRGEQEQHATFAKDPGASAFVRFFRWRAKLDGSASS